MIQETFTPAKGGRLDKLRHSDPKIDRKLRGVGSRAKQYAVVVELAREGNRMAMDVVTDNRTARSSSMASRERHGLKNWTVALTSEQIARITRIKGDTTNAEWLMRAADAYEKRDNIAGGGVRLHAEVLAKLESLARTEGCGVQEFVSRLIGRWEHGGLSTEAASRLNALQSKIGAKSQADTVQRLAAMVDAAQASTDTLHRKDEALSTARAEIKALQRQLAEETAGANTLASRLQAAQAECDARQRECTELRAQIRAGSGALVTVAPAPVSEEVQSALFDFVQAFAGSTATLAPSGDVIVEPPAGAMAQVFAAWSRAVKALGLVRQAG